jgi:23S rRNA (guanosine2251-2'-O)-methyltransferase
MMAKPGNPSAGKGKKKGPLKGTGGNGRKALEGKGPTPRPRTAAGTSPASARRRWSATPPRARARVGGAVPRPKARRDDTENVTGAQLRARGAARAHPATAFYIAQRVEMDDRVKEMLSIATQRGIP